MTNMKVSGNRNSRQKPSRVSFRKLVSEIPSTSYVTHSIHYYPASFIPQVVRYCLNKFTEPYDWVLDPFAGSGAVAVECFITKRHVTLVDINPITSSLVKSKLLIPNEDARFEMRQLLLKSLSYKGKPFVPKWKNLRYWHPTEEIIEFLTKLWGYIHYECESYLKPLLVFTALDVTRFLSYADDVVPKLFKSKRKTRKLDDLLTKNWKKIAIKRYEKVADDYVSAIFELKRHVRGENPITEVYSPQDIETWNPTRKYQLIVSSPPYMQAQEYIRSSKIDLYWLGYDDKEMRKFRKLEIPYRAPKGKVHTPTLDIIRDKVIELDRKDLAKLFDSYFYFMLTNFQKVSRNLLPEGHLCIFVGSPTIGGINVPLWKILCEYFREYGFIEEKVFEDRIVARKLFGFRNNLNPNGILSEYLTILRRT